MQYPELERDVDRLLIRDAIEKKVRPRLSQRLRQVLDAMLADEDDYTAVLALNMTWHKYHRRRAWILYKCHRVLWRTFA